MDIQEFTTDARGASNRFAAVMGLFFLGVGASLVWLLFAGKYSDKDFVLVALALIAAALGVMLLVVFWKVRSIRVTINAHGIAIEDQKGRQVLPWKEYASFINNGGKLVLYDVSGVKRFSFPSSIKRINDVLPLLVDFEIRGHRDHVNHLLSTLAVPYVSATRFRALLSLVAVTLLWWYASSKGLPAFFSIAMTTLILIWTWVGACPWISVSPLSLEYMNPIFKKAIDVQDIRDVKIAYSTRVNEVSQTGQWDKRLIVICEDGRKISINVDDHAWMEIYLLLCKLTGKLERMVGSELR